MRITILALGSRGDVQPFVALALGLRDAGHAVTIAAAEDYAPLVRAYGLAFAPLVGSVRALVDPDTMGMTVRGGMGRIVRSWFRDVPPILAQLLRDAATACQGTEGLIVSSLALIALPFLHERCPTRTLVAQFHPSVPTRHRPQTFFPPLPRGVPGRSAYYRLTYPLFAHGQSQLLRPAFNHARRAGGMPPLGAWALWERMRDAAPTTLHAYSPAVAPPDPDMGPDATPIGYWFLPPPPGWEPDPALLAFLDMGPPPVYIGFGSVMHGRAGGTQLTATLVEALRQSGLRGIIGRGWGDLAIGALPPWCLAVDDVPHGWLFPHVAGVVHHGGAGVTGAALRAGVPSLVVPFLGDQAFWAERLVALGAGLPPLRVASLDIPTLTTALKTLVERPELRAGAQRVSETLAQEDGIGTAVRRIEQHWQTETMA